MKVITRTGTSFWVYVLFLIGLALGCFLPNGVVYFIQASLIGSGACLLAALIYFGKYPLGSYQALSILQTSHVAKRMGKIVLFQLLVLGVTLACFFEFNRFANANIRIPIQEVDVMDLSILQDLGGLWLLSFTVPVLLAFCYSYQVYYAHKVPMLSDFILNRDENPKQFFWHSAIFDIVSSGRLLALVILVMMVITLFLELLTEAFNMPSPTQYPLTMTFIGLLVGLSSIKTIRSISSWLLSHQWGIGSLMLLFSLLLTVALLAFFGMLYPKVAKYLPEQTMSGGILSLIDTSLRAYRFQTLLLAWMVLWTPQLSLVYTKLFYGLKVWEASVASLLPPVIFMIFCQVSLSGYFAWDVEDAMPFLHYPYSAWFLLAVLFFVYRRVKDQKTLWTANLPGSENIKSRSVINFMVQLIFVFPFMTAMYFYFGWVIFQFLVVGCSVYLILTFIAVVYQTRQSILHKDKRTSAIYFN